MTKGSSTCWTRTNSTDFPYNFPEIFLERSLHEAAGTRHAAANWLNTAGTRLHPLRIPPSFAAERSLASTRTQKMFDRAFKEPSIHLNVIKFKLIFKIKIFDWFSLVTVPADSLSVEQMKPSTSSVNVSHKVEGVYPEPVLELVREDAHQGER